MALTSFQKNYIKKNWKKLSVEEMSLELGVNARNILKYYKKHGIEADKKADGSGYLVDVKNFKFYEFFSDNIFIFVGLFILVLIVYLNSLNNAFVSDDIAAILRNPAIDDFKYIFGGLIRFSPQGLIHFTAYHLGGLNPAYFRTVNIILHLLSVFSIFTLLSLISKKKIAILAAIIFAVHPILIESVTWISGMPYALGGLFVLLSFIFYILGRQPAFLDIRCLSTIKSKRHWMSFKYFLSLLFFLLALASSEKTAPFPAILFLYELVFSPLNGASSLVNNARFAAKIESKACSGVNTIFSDLKRYWKKLIPYFSLSFLWVIIYVGKIGMRKEALTTVYYQQSGTDNPLSQVPVAIVTYLKLIFWPKALTLYHTDLHFSVGQFVIIFLVFLAFLAAIAVSYWKNKKIFFWLSFFVITLLPTLTPLRISWVVAERYVYLGSIGIFVVVAMFFDWLSEKEKIKNYAFALFAIIILALSVRTILRNIDWKNEDNLWIATAKVSDAGPNIHNNLGDMYSRHGDFEKAAEEFKKSVEINPRYADGVHNLGLTYMQMGKLDEAIEQFKKAAAMSPILWQPYQMMAYIYFNQGKYDLALEAIKKALEINPSDQTLQENLKTIESKL
ncbi:MAG: tetratricopeptide repeat protein [Candidatus Moranbacteria bacterium]|nr:tetratricopeptide repeat protein [Candidatus Moranbacteria bacterium]